MGLPEQVSLASLSAIRLFPQYLMSLILTFCVTYSDTNVINSEILHSRSVSDGFVLALDT